MKNVRSIETRLISNQAYRWNYDNDARIRIVRSVEAKSNLLRQAAKAGTEWARTRYRFRIPKRTEMSFLQKEVQDTYLHLRSFHEACFRAWIAGAFFIRELKSQNG